MKYSLDSKHVCLLPSVFSAFSSHLSWFFIIFGSKRKTPLLDLECGLRWDHNHTRCTFFLIIAIAIHVFALTRLSWPISVTAFFEASEKNKQKRNIYDYEVTRSAIRFVAIDSRRRCAMFTSIRSCVHKHSSTKWNLNSFMYPRLKHRVVNSSLCNCAQHSWND